MGADCTRRSTARGETCLKGHKIRVEVSEVYCARGDMENRIKEQQLGLFADRTSTRKLAGNQLRLYFSAFAYVMMETLRRVGLAGTKLARAQSWTLRVRLLKIGAQVRIMTRKVWLSFPRATPMRRCCRRFWRKCKPIRFAVSENQPYGKRPVGSPRGGLCPGVGSWGRNVAHECRREVKCPWTSPDFGFRQRIRVGRRALEFIWIRKPLKCC